MTSPAGHSKRINERLMEYWQQKRGGRPYPDESELDPDELSDIWDSCFLVHLEGYDGKMPIFKYTYLGESIIEAYGDDLTNREVCERLVYPANNSLVLKFGEVAKTAAPTIEDSEFTNKNGVLIKFRAALLPLSKHTPQVSYIIGGMKWKAF